MCCSCERQRNERDATTTSSYRRRRRQQRHCRAEHYIIIYEFAARVEHEARTQLLNPAAQRSRDRKAAAAPAEVAATAAVLAVPVCTVQSNLNFNQFYLRVCLPRVA